MLIYNGVKSAHKQMLHKHEQQFEKKRSEKEKKSNSGSIGTGVNER